MIDLPTLNDDQRLAMLMDDLEFASVDDATPCRMAVYAHLEQREARIRAAPRAPNTVQPQPGPPDAAQPPGEGFMKASVPGPDSGRTP